MKKLLALLLAMVMLFTLAACGGKDKEKEDKEEKEDGVAGKYLLASVEIDGEEMSEEDMIDEFGDDSYIELEDDGTATLRLEGNKTKMEYKDDEIWDVEDEDTVFEIEIKKDTVILNMEMDDEEAVLTFEKEEEEEEEETEDEDETEEETEEEPEDTKPQKTEPEETEPEETDPVVEPTEEEEDNVRYLEIYTVYIDDVEYSPSDVEWEDSNLYIDLANGTIDWYFGGNDYECEYDENSIWDINDPDEVFDLEFTDDGLNIGITTDSGSYVEVVYVLAD